MSVVSDGTNGGAAQPAASRPPAVGRRRDGPRGPPLAPGHSRRGALVGPRTPGDVPTRRWGRFAAGVPGPGRRPAVRRLVPVRGLAGRGAGGGRDIGAYEAIERDDLRIERVAAEPDVATVDGVRPRRHGRTRRGHRHPRGRHPRPRPGLRGGPQLVGDGEVVVGMEVSLAEAPATLATGDSVLLGVEPGPAPTDPTSWSRAGCSRSATATTTGDALDVSVVVPHRRRRGRPGGRRRSGVPDGDPGRLSGARHRARVGEGLTGVTTAAAALAAVGTAASGRPAGRARPVGRIGAGPGGGPRGVGPGRCGRATAAPSGARSRPGQRDGAAPRRPALLAPTGRHIAESVIASAGTGG